LGHAFFTLSLGMGAIMVYGSYLPRDTSIVGTSITIAVADTVVALLAGLAIFPVVFANNLDPGSGPGLIFETLPLAFGNMPGGAFFGTLFFVLLLFAAWTSAISLIEPAVAWLSENHGMNRVMASAVAGIVTWLIGVLTVLSFNKFAFKFSFFGAEKTTGIFDILDILTANIMLPLGGILMAVFAGWVMSKKHSQEELAISDSAYKVWAFLAKFVSPVLVLIMLLHLFGILEKLGLA
jgi:NSS family neurotransmitter:Na+ symporter